MIPYRQGAAHSHMMPNRLWARGLPHDTLQTGGSALPHDAQQTVGQGTPTWYPTDRGHGDSHMMPYRQGARWLPLDNQQTGELGTPTWCPTDWGARGLPHDTLQTGGQGNPTRCPTYRGPGDSHMIPSPILNTACTSANSCRRWVTVLWIKWHTYCVQHTELNYLRYMHS